MKNYITLKLFVIFLLLLPIQAFSNTENITLNGETLQLNGSGYRSKFFIKVYEGFLYLPTNLTSTESPVTDENTIFEKGYPGAIKMKFVYSKVDSDKMKNAFKEGFEENSPELLDKNYISGFLEIFNFDVLEGDILTLFFKSKNNVTVIYNGENIGNIKGENIGIAVYKIYLGKEPADSSLKDDMLGK